MSPNWSSPSGPAYFVCFISRQRARKGLIRLYRDKKELKGQWSKKKKKAISTYHVLVVSKEMVENGDKCLNAANLFKHSAQNVFHCLICISFVSFPCWAVSSSLKNTVIIYYEIFVSCDICSYNTMFFKTRVWLVRSCRVIPFFLTVVLAVIQITHLYQ